MGVRGEIFTTKVALENRTYFFNVKENRLGDLYLNIVESKNRDAGGFERQSIILFSEDMKEFLTGFDESLKVLEKAEREKRKGEKPRGVSKRETRADPEYSGKKEYKPRDSKKSRPRPEGGYNERPRTSREKTWSGERPDNTRPKRESPRSGREKPKYKSGNSESFRPDREKPVRKVVRRKDY